MNFNLYIISVPENKVLIFKKHLKNISKQYIWLRLTGEPSEPFQKFFDFYNFEYKSLKNHILELVHLLT